MTQNIYHNVETSFHSPRTNETDYKSFGDFHKEREKIYRTTGKRNYKETIKLNIQQWDESVPRQYSRLSLRKMNTSASKKIIKKMVDSKNKNLFFYGQNVVEREKIVYSVLRDYVAMDFTSFSRVEHITDNDITTWGTVGFEGFKKIDALLNKTETNIIVIHGFKDKDYTEKELRTLESIINHCFYNNITLIFSSNVSMGFYRKVLPAQVSALLESIVERNIMNL